MTINERSQMGVSHWAGLSTLRCWGAAVHIAVYVSKISSKNAVLRLTHSYLHIHSSIQFNLDICTCQLMNITLACMAKKLK